MEVDAFVQSGLDRLRGETLTWSTYEQWSPEWDHDHCEFCFAKFTSSNHAMADDSDTLQAGWTTADRYRWVCEDCERTLERHATWTAAPRT